MAEVVAEKNVLVGVVIIDYLYSIVLNKHEIVGIGNPSNVGQDIAVTNQEVGIFF